MMSNDFEEAFSSFLERKEYDEAENAPWSASPSWRAGKRREENLRYLRSCLS